MTRNLDQHLVWCRERNLRPSYVVTRRRCITNLSRTLGYAVEDVTADELEGWYREFAERVTPEARATGLSHVQCYFRWLVRAGFRDDDPSLHLVRPRTKAGLPRPIRDDALRVALDTAGPRVRPWLLLAAFQGLRTLEIANLRVQDVNLADGLLLVADGKGGKQRLLPLHPDVASALRPLLPARGYVFAHWSRSGPPTPQNVGHAINQHLRACGIEDTAHALRHWFLTKCHEQSRDLLLTAKLAGHANPQTTMGYVAWSQESARDVVANLKVR